MQLRHPWPASFINAEKRIYFRYKSWVSDAKKPRANLFDHTHVLTPTPDLMVLWKEKGPTRKEVYASEPQVYI